MSAPIDQLTEDQVKRLRQDEDSLRFYGDQMRELAMETGLKDLIIVSTQLSAAALGVAQILTWHKEVQMMKDGGGLAMTIAPIPPPAKEPV